MSRSPRSLRPRAQRGAWRLLAALVMAVALPVAASRSLAYDPPMEHSEDCPMPEQNRGTPTVLSLPAPPPPPTTRPVEVRVVTAEVVTPRPATPRAAPLRHTPARAPPRAALSTP